MKLYLLTQNKYTDYGTFDSCVVAAESEENAREIRPTLGGYLYNDEWPSDTSVVKVTYLGEAVDESFSGIICASFNAG